MKIGPMGQLPFKEMLGAVAAMGFAPSEARRWSYWEYHAVVEGWNEANALAEDDKPPAPDISTLRAAKARHAREMAAAAEKAQAEKATAI